MLIYSYFQLENFIKDLFFINPLLYFAILKDFLEYFHEHF